MSTTVGDLLNAQSNDNVDARRAKNSKGNSKIVAKLNDKKYEWQQQCLYMKKGKERKEKPPNQNCLNTARNETIELGFIQKKNFRTRDTLDHIFTIIRDDAKRNYALESTRQSFTKLAERLERYQDHICRAT